MLGSILVRLRIFYIKFLNINHSYDIYWKYELKIIKIVY